MENVALNVPFCGETECCFYFVEYALEDLKELGKKALSNIKKLGKEYVNTYYIEKYLQFKKVDSETQAWACSDRMLKEDLWPNLQSCFYGIFLLILWRENLAQNFVVFWSYFK